MNEFYSLLQSGTTNAWLFIPGAIVLGILHGLEPGHSKTMMAAFIIAVRGTVMQAVLLGIAATLSHTAVIWVIALGGLYFGQQWAAETNEPYLQIASAVLIVGVGCWMTWRTWHQQRTCFRNHAHDHDDSAVKWIDTGHGTVRLEVFENGTSARFRLYRNDGHGHVWMVDQVYLETERPDGGRQAFHFAQCDGFMESVEEIPEPHEFVARLRLGHEHHCHDYDVEFVEQDHHHHAIQSYEALDVAAPGYQDPHELAHANDIRRRFSDREVTTGQIILFGLTGGLIPCPASITVLLLCLQLKKIALGAILVLCFSIGLAFTMVASGVLAALSVKHISQHWSGFDTFARKVPYLSGALILCVGAYIGYQGFVAIQS